MHEPGEKTRSAKQIGQQQAFLDGDVLLLRLCGEYTPDEARQVLTLADGLYREHGQVFILIDMTNMHTFGPETRKVVASWKYLGVYSGAGFGLSLVLRAAGKLVMAAQRLIGTGPQFAGETFATEAEARAWLALERKKRSTGQAPKNGND